MKRLPTGRLAGSLAALMILLVVAGIGAGCAAGPAAATATPTKTPRPAFTATQPPPPTATPVPPTVTPLPTATPLPPTATAEPSPTEVVSAPAEEASAGGSTDVIHPAREAGVSAFTGLRPADPAVLLRRPVAIKVANQASVIPQSGLSKADIVVESRVEFCESRYTAVYQSQTAPRVGSIRSARLIDVELPVIFDAILAFSGGVEPVRQKLYKSDFGDHILEQARNGKAFYRDTKINVPDNLFADTETIWKTAVARKWNQTPNPSAAWTFSEAAPAGGKSASRIDLPYPRFRVAWTYDAASGRWLRILRGEPHIEKVDGTQLSAATVVILGANHVQTLIPEHGTTLTNGNCSNRSIEIQLWGQGPLKVLRDGKVYEGQWLRPDRHAPFRFVDAKGKDLPVKPGNAWWQVVPLEMKITVTP